MKRKCAMCGEYKEETEFYKEPNGYYYCYCNNCRRLYNREYKRIKAAREIDKLTPIK